jgi:hypothetical protein
MQRHRHRHLRFPAILAGASLVLLPLTAQAQQPTSADTMFLHAHRLVSQGQGTAGRALIDSLLGTMPAGSPEHAEGLFWRAVTAAKAEDAERDYLRIVIEYPLSSRAEDALIRLAELEMMRGDRMRAQRHLQRLIVEHPNGVSRARASYWLARVYFDGNDFPRACNELNVARARAAAGDVELRNQVDYQAQRCVGVAVIAPSQPAPMPAPSGGTTTAMNPSATASSTLNPPPPKPPVLAPTPPATPMPAPAQATSSQPTSPQQQTTPPVQASTQGTSAAPPQPVTPPVTAASTATVPPAATPAPPRTVTTPSSSGRTSPGFSVQVAAFPTEAAAIKFRESLAARGYDVRVWGTEAPFRVRVGRFATRAEATTLAQELRAKMIAKDAWVVEAEVR